MQPSNQLLHICKYSSSDCSYHDNFIGEPIETFPDPIPYTDPAEVEHYQAGKNSNETKMLNKLIDATKRKTNVLFPTSAQTASNVGIFLRCVNCCRPRLHYAQKKLQASELNTLKRALNGFQFICGTPLQEMIRDDNLSCTSNIETPHLFIGKFTKICIICGKSTNVHPDDKINFPQCRRCNNPRIKITRRRKNLGEDLGGGKKEKLMYFTLYKFTIEKSVQHCIKHISLLIKPSTLSCDLSN